MEKLDQRMQQRVWARVYGGRPMALTARQRQAMQSALYSSRRNLAFFESMESHGLYGAAFERLSRDTKEQIKMLQQMLRG